MGCQSFATLLEDSASRLLSSMVGISLGSAAATYSVRTLSTAKTDSDTDVTTCSALFSCEADDG
jgi:hypothetical protein